RAKKNVPGYKPEVVISTRKAGDKVVISIRDNGTGIPPHVIEKIFNPFFTTKPTGKGTGLGLSMSFDIVSKLHKGKLEVRSEDGEFTEFVITIPEKQPKG
ncbi:MAG TPA: ATP-binding protein, partial [Bacteroidales bacterium]|nr:ATP-binding protein [Bacteroidales bacterium]